MDTPSRIGVAAQQLGSDGLPLVEPGAFFVDGNYALKMTVWNAVPSLAVNLRVRFLKDDGRVTDSDYLLTPTSNRIGTSAIFPLAVGFPMNVTAFVINGLPQPGQTFVQVQLVRGFSGVLLPVATILQDYITAAQAIAFPGSPIRSALDGQGALRNVAGTTPAAGAEIAEVVPSGARWELISFECQLVASGVVANRILVFTLDSAGLVFFRGDSNFTLTAGLTAKYTYAEGMMVSMVGHIGALQAGLPVNNRLFSLSNIRSVTTGLDVGDQYSAVQLLVREWIDATTL